MIYEGQFWSNLFGICDHKLHKVYLLILRGGTEGGISSYLLCDILTALEVMVSIRQDFWLHDGYQAILGKERRGFFKAMKVKLLCLFALILVVFLCAVCFLLFLSQNPCRDSPFKLPSMLSQGTGRKGSSISGEVAGGEVPAGRCWHSVPMCWHSPG